MLEPRSLDAAPGWVIGEMVGPEVLEEDSPLSVVVVASVVGL